MFYLAKKNLQINKLICISSIILGLSVNTNSFSSTYKKRVDNTLIANDSKSFITTAIEKSGPAVVTIDTQRLVKPNNFSKYGSFSMFGVIEILLGFTSL